MILPLVPLNCTQNVFSIQQIEYHTVFLGCSKWLLTVGCMFSKKLPETF